MTEPSFCSGSLRVITANNDSQVRVFEAENFASLGCFNYDWSVNVSIINRYFCYYSLHLLKHLFEESSYLYTLGIAEYFG